MYVAYVKNIPLNTIIDGIRFTSSKVNLVGNIILCDSSARNGFYCEYNSRRLYHTSWLDTITELNGTHGVAIVVINGYNAFIAYRSENGIRDLKYNKILHNVASFDFDYTTMNTHYTSITSTTICPSCNEEMFLISVTHGRTGIVCDDCALKCRKTCINCGRLFYDIDQKGEHYCEECRIHVGKCHKCEKEVFMNPSNKIEQFYFCDECVETIEFTRCHSCGVRFFKHSIDNYCDICLFQKRTRSFSGGILNYSDKPPINIYDHHTKKDTLLIGMELELTTPLIRHAQFDDSYARWIQHELNKEREFIYCKWDRSIKNDGLGGFEIVTHPFSFSYIKSLEGKNKIEKLEYLNRCGCDAENNGTCGIHIHLSKNHFTSLHLYKFLKFIYNNKNFVSNISPRTNKIYSEQYSSYVPQDKIINLSKIKIHNSSNSLRHRAVNLSNPDTVEIRVFNSTLNPKKIYKIIEFCVSLFYFTKNCSLNKNTSDEFIKFIKIHNKKYPNLFEFIRSL